MWQSLLNWWRALRAPRVATAPAPSAEIALSPTARAEPAPVPLRCASVVIPALNEAEHIASVVKHALADAATAEVIVIDDSSIDDTASLARAAGARVVRSTLLGKGASMADGAREAAHEFIVYLDGDLSGLEPGLVSRLVAPLAADRADFVKASFGRSGGRVTELTARPMLKVFFPELAGFAQPLGGLVAARRQLLRQLSFEDGYGVDIGLLIDAQRAGARLVQADIGKLVNDSQPLADLAMMANEVSRVIYQRARSAGRLHVQQIAQMHESQRQAAAAIEFVLARRRGRQKLLLLDLDGTLTPEHFIDKLARSTGVERELQALRDEGVPLSGDQPRVAALFRFVPKAQFERVAMALPLRDGVVSAVNALRRSGFMVGVVSSGWFVVAELVRRRVFADFALAHLMQFDGEACTGEVQLNPAFLPLRHSGPEGHAGFAKACSSEVVRHFRSDEAQPPVDTVWAVGDDLDDLALLRAAGRAFVIAPKSARLVADAGAVEIRGFDELLAHSVQAAQASQAERKLEESAQHAG